MIFIKGCKVNIESNEHKLDLKDLSKFEGEFNVILPCDYREFLLCINGGVPLEIVNVDVPNAPEMPTDLQLFFGINTEIESISLEWNTRLFRDRFGVNNVVPIATDSFGNLFSLEIDDEGKADVIYIDLEYGRGAGYFVCDSFSKFLEYISIQKFN